MVTQKRNDATYDAEMTKWRASNPTNADGLTSENVQQHLSLGREADANLTIISSTGQEDDSFFWPRGWDAAADQSLRGTNNAGYERMKTDLKIDSKSVKTIVFPPNVNGNVTVEYSNLNNSDYTDNNGNKVNIGKIRLTYTVSSSDSKHGIIIFSDPTDGFGLLNADNVNLTDFSFYDKTGNKISLADNTAYLAITSLNHHGVGSIETVTSGKNTKAYALAGSSITKQGNSLYAKESNETIKNGGTWNDETHGGQWWDNKGPYEYYGTGILSLSGADYGMSFSVQNASVDPGLRAPGNGPWFTFTTIIPETPTPTRKTTEVHYHYNQAYDLI